MKRVRCAIYTRKSSEEGLEQGFNSLDAQREACAAYILSQASEGWSLIPEHYDDGGISGGTLERPALTRLRADITAGKIDIVVVYKVDRLTRSLLDFAKLVETFDKAEVSFVSVTQSFNTTTSMGRLTLNMLLSFAQFEREVTAERIRDKIAASKAKGMWMGGTPPIGYEPHGRSLKIVEADAAIVRDIFYRYLELGNVRLVAEALERDGVRSPRRQRAKSGVMFGGVPLSRGQLYKILGNPIYIGDIPHQGKVYPGQHTAIIERQTWEAAQALMASHRQGTKRAGGHRRSPLAGIIVDSGGEPMLAAHATKQNTRYRYHVSRSLHLGEGDRTTGMRLPAREIEACVKHQLAELFDDPLSLAARLALEISPFLLRQITERSQAIAARLRGPPHELLREIVDQVRVYDGKIEISVRVDAVASVLGVEAPLTTAEPIVISTALRLTRTGKALRLLQNDGSLTRDGEPDVALVQLVAKARAWWHVLAQGELDITALAKREGCQDAYISRAVRVAFLSPVVIEGILAGRQRGGLTATHLRSTDAVPADWRQQASRFLPSEA